MRKPIIYREKYKNKAVTPCRLTCGVNRHFSLIYLTMENLRPGWVPLWPARLAMTRLLKGISRMIEGLSWAHQFHDHLPLHTCNTIPAFVWIGSEQVRTIGNLARVAFVLYKPCLLYISSSSNLTLRWQIHSTYHDVAFIRVWMSFGNIDVPKAAENILRMAILVSLLSPLTLEHFWDSFSPEKTT